MEQSNETRRILVVDDEVEIGNALKRELRGWAVDAGVTIESRTNGEEALEHIRENDVAVLLTDNRMPGMTGAELVKQVAQVSPMTVTMILTGYTDKADLEAAFGAGIFGFLVKPWDRAALAEELTKALAAHETRRRRLDSTQRVREELRLAREFRRQLLNTRPRRSHAIVTPDVGRFTNDQLEIGGDYVDILEPGADSYLVLLGDVVGKGLRGTFITAMLKAVLMTEFIQPRVGLEVISPAEMLNWLNRRVIALTESFPDLYVSFAAFRVDELTRTITWAIAGNPFPLVKNGNRIRSVPLPGIALGIQDYAHYAEAQTVLSPGEQMYVFTDGVAPAGTHREGRDRDDLYATLIERREGESADSLLQRLHERRTEDRYTDDMTLVQLECARTID